VNYASPAKKKVRLSRLKGKKGRAGKSIEKSFQWGPKDFEVLYL